MPKNSAVFTSAYEAADGTKWHPRGDRDNKLCERLPAEILFSGKNAGRNDSILGLRETRTRRRCVRPRPSEPASNGRQCLSGARWMTPRCSPVPTPKRYAGRQGNRAARHLFPPATQVCWQRRRPGTSLCIAGASSALLWSTRVPVEAGEECRREWLSGFSRFRGGRLRRRRRWGAKYLIGAPDVVRVQLHRRGDFSGAQFAPAKNGNDLRWDRFEFESAQAGLSRKACQSCVRRGYDNGAGEIGQSFAGNQVLLNQLRVRTGNFIFAGVELAAPGIEQRYDSAVDASRTRHHFQERHGHDRLLKDLGQRLDCREANS